MARSGIWKGSIRFGLLNIPVSLQSANAQRDLHFSMLDEKDLAPIKFRRVNAVSGREVPYRRIVKGFEFEKGEFVIMNSVDFKAANPQATQTIDIEDFVLLDEIDTMLFDKPYFLVPQRNGEKGYFLLRDALVKSKKIAIGKIVIRTKQHLVAILTRGDYLILEILRFAHEVLDAESVNYLDGISKKTNYNPRELKMAEELIAGMTAKWQPEKYKDTYYDDIMKRIKTKVKQGKGHTISEPDEAPEVETSSDKVVDLLPLLRKSILAGKSSRASAGRKSKSKVKHETAG